MKILFLCGSSEPGKDGVGDYVRIITTSLLRKGCEVIIVAIADSFISEDKQDGFYVEGAVAKVFRYTTAQTLNERVEMARQVLLDFDPEVVSLQYVAFAFHQKGLPFGLSREIIALTKGFPLHIMFHELWVGMSKESSIKNKVWGRIQKTLIRNFLKKTRPACISTQTLLYQQQLKRMGYGASYLPLVSNIPVAVPPVQPEAAHISVLELVIFGTIHTEAMLEPFTEEVARYAEEINKEVVLVFVGRCGPEQQKWIDTWKSRGLRYIVKGEQTAVAVSRILSTATLGLSTTAFALIEKSGTLAAMQAHGLPAICLSAPWTPEISVSPVLGYATNVVEYRKGIVKDVMGHNRKFVNRKNEPEIVAEAFIRIVLQPTQNDRLS